MKILTTIILTAIGATIGTILGNYIGTKLWNRKMYKNANQKRP